MAEIVEQRVRSTVIRRRAKKEEAPPAPAVEEVINGEFQEGTAPSSEAAAPSAPVAHVTPVKAAPEPVAAPTPASAEKLQEVVTRPSSRAEGSPLRGLRIIKQAEPQPVAKPTPPPTTAAVVKELEDKFKKAPKKKLSKAEMDFEAIRRAGGLKHFVASDEVKELAEPPKEQVQNRVFEPGPRRRRMVRREFKKTSITQPKASKKVIKIDKVITVSELSQGMGVKTGEIIKKLMDLGIMATVNQSIDVDTATLLAKEFGHEIEHTAFQEEKVIEGVKKTKGSNVLARPPVVTVMGHVDHGKTSVLDYIRKAKVAAGEAGGITQHIGAYEVMTSKGKITFIDTPGHAAFTAMRARGAKVTDIVILVVAADDGVMPQTKEAIDHSRAAGVPIIVAINKIDKPEANLERAKRSLSEYGILPEEWGGDVICVGTSAKTGEGIDQLLDMVLLQSEVMELKADSGTAAKGAIIEAKLDRGLGPVATILVQEGTLKVGASIISGLHCGKVRTLINTRGEQVESAGPSEAVSLIGLTGVPMAGDELIEVEDDKAARTISEQRQQKQRFDALSKTARVTLEDLHKQVAEGSLKDLKLVLKADVNGSAEAIKESVPKLSTEKVKVSIIHAGVGAVTESDVMLASASGAIIIGFNVVPEAGVAAIAEREGVEIRRYTIIYELMDEVRMSMEGLLTPLQVEKITGHAEVRQVFNISKFGVIAGCSVKDGKIVRNAGVRLLRDNAVIYSGKMDSLKRFKDDAREVNEGNECGISIGYNDIKEGDIIEAFIIEQVAQKM
ncbi:MAG: translation initiation factor IF-2 [Deltaproteobacteria bacterium CG11_big_fil_rev_8_21_14_0_20_49_13]|nr:MAG: translation initiation factor IF-2 [Deltaproteobacteria bacterium CG11_big_fil_rev_8_21_14_0_20_49_13]